REHLLYVAEIEKFGRVRTCDVVVPSEWRVWFLEDVLSPLAAVREIELRGPRVDDEVLKKVRPFRRATDLTIWRTSVTDDSLDLLTSLTNLKSLNLTGSTITDEGIAWLKQVRPDLTVIRNYTFQESERISAILEAGGDVGVFNGEAMEIRFDPYGWP